jgi:hypothetical protein
MNEWKAKPNYSKTDLKKNKWKIKHIVGAETCSHVCVSHICLKD